MSGKLEVITGCMFSGKSSYLIKKAKYKMSDNEVVCFKPGSDTRYEEAKISTHDGFELEAVNVESSQEIFEEVMNREVDVIAIDEANLLDEDLYNVADELADRGYHVICAGTDQNYKGEPFSPVPELMALSDELTKLNAICRECGSRASKNYRKVESDEEVVVGGEDKYEPRCRKCHSY